MPELRSVAFTSGDGTTPIPSYLAVPDGAGPHPTVLILRGVAGPADGYTEIAERLAGWGYAALIHGWKIRGHDPPDDLVYADMQGAIAYLHSVREADLTRLAVFGFCRGGVHAFLAARAHDEIRAIVVFHGFAFRSPRAQPGAQPYDLVEAVNVPALIMHGTEDEQAPPTASRGRRRALISAANQPPPRALRRSSPWDFHHWCRIVMSVPTEKCRTPMSRKYFA
jgi:carboxymethylenebutenolidase